MRLQRGPAGVGPGLNFTNAGTNAQLGGTNWWTADAKGIVQPKDALEEACCIGLGLPVVTKSAPAAKEA